jgi:hypothetical protein
LDPDGTLDRRPRHGRSEKKASHLQDLLAREVRRAGGWKRRHQGIARLGLRTLEGFRLSGGKWTLVATFEGDATVKPEPFDAVELDLGALSTL